MTKRAFIVAILGLAAILCSASISLINLTTQVSGILPVVNGGTGQSTALVPAGMITFINSGTCPTGWTEMSLSGSYVLATVAANGDVGTTGGSTSYTPAGTVAAPTFTGSAGTTGASTIAFTGTKMTTSGSGTAAVTNVGGTSITTAGQNLGSHTHSFTPAGTVSAPAFTGTPATIQPSYIKLIPCQKN